MLNEKDPRQLNLCLKYDFSRIIHVNDVFFYQVQWIAAITVCGLKALYMSTNFLLKDTIKIKRLPIINRSTCGQNVLNLFPLLAYFRQNGNI